MERGNVHRGEAALSERSHEGTSLATGGTRDLRAKRQPRGRTLLAILAIAAFGGLVPNRTETELVTQTVTYEHEGTTFEGFLAYDDAIAGPRPGVVIVHQWMGLTSNEKMRAKLLAELGYVAFAADIYGQGVRPASREEAAAEAGKYYGNRELLRQRVRVAVDALRGTVPLQGGGEAGIASVDGAQIAAIGYCFGGGAVLELARSGADVAGVVSFHGSLDTPNPEDAKHIRCPILVLHGAEDPHVSREKVNGFLDEMKAADVDFQFVAYSGAVHAFTQREAGSDTSTGAAYDAKADARSWRAMQDFFGEIFP